MCLIICLTKEVKDLFNENLKKLKNIPEDRKTSHDHGLVELI